MNLVNHHVLATLAATVAICATAGVAHAERIKVAVVPGIAVNLDAARVDALSQDLAGALQAELDIDANGGLEVRRLLPPDGIPPDCIAQPECIQEVAARTGANQLLFVVMIDTGSGGAIQVDTTWVEPATGKTAPRPALDIASVSDARERFAAAATMLLPDAPVRAKPAIGGPGPATRMAPAVPRHFTTPAKITAAASLVGLGVGIGFGLKARSKYNACEADPVDCSRSDRDGIRRLGLAADAGYLVAIGSAIATTVLFATSGREAHLIVEPSTEGLTVGAVGRF